MPVYPLDSLPPYNSSVLSIISLPLMFSSVFLSLKIFSKNIITEMAGFIFKVDDAGDEEETNMRNGGDRGMSVYVLKAPTLILWSQS